MKGKKTESINAFIIGENKIVEKDNINKSKAANLESKIEGIENKLESLNEKKDKVDGRITTLWAKREEVSQVEAGIRAKYGPSISSQVKQANQPKFTKLEKKISVLSQGKLSQLQIDNIIKAVKEGDIYTEKGIGSHSINVSALRKHTSSEMLQQYGMANKVQDFGRRQYVKVNEIVPSEDGVKFISALKEIAQLASEQKNEINSKMENVFADKNIMSKDHYMEIIEKSSQKGHDLNEEIITNNNELMQNKIELRKITDLK
ncbi:hypothetical protein [Yersinia sp. 1652 StPb PI]|uniref:hypothetical protein n=1 Tax=Yersinia sp. 1652 StPb PI TaxID=3061649 RepID=UPI00355BE0FF